MENKEISLIKKEFERRFGKIGEFYFAPSRINIIGEHIDYNGGRVLPCAIEIGTYAMACKNDLGLLRCFSINIGDYVEISLDDLSNKKENSWANYVAGMVKYILQDGYNAGGFDIVVYGNIPYAAGISSSASLEMLIGEVVNDLFNDNSIERIKMPHIGQKVENLHFGLNSGIMDQFAINMGKKDNAIFLDTATLDYRYIPVDLGENVFVILNTNKRRELKDSKYNERRAETEKGLEILQKYVSIKNLCELSDNDETHELIRKIQDTTIEKRVTHVVEENARVQKMIDAMRASDYETMGKLLDESHFSLKFLYEVTGAELDAVTDAARKCKYTYGARMTGAGFAGCAIALIKKEGLNDFEETVSKEYKRMTGRTAQIICSQIGDGPKKIKVEE